MAALAALLVAWGLAGQAARAQPAFEVVSIRSHKGPLHRIFGYSSSGTRLTLEGYPLVGLVMEAYGLRNFQVSFARSASHSDETYYDILAIAPGEEARSRGDFQQMLQLVLKERFSLNAHREMKEMPIYALVIGRNGPKFGRSSADAIPASNHGVHGRNQTMNLVNTTMGALAESLGNYVSDRPVSTKQACPGPMTSGSRRLRTSEWIGIRNRVRSAFSLLSRSSSG